MEGLPSFPFGYPLRHTRAVVDLDALDHNLTLLAGRVAGAGMVPAVKADGYGHGAAAIAAACEGWGATMVAVANLEEYLYLRDRGITLPVLILEELFPEEVEPALREGARLTAGSLAYARLLSEKAGQLGTTAMMHINVDTGMGRMGLSGEDLVTPLMEIASLPDTTIEGVYSHFPGSDEVDTSFAHEQIRRTRSVLQALEDKGVSVRYRHIANSGALIQFPREVAWDLVRPGVAMYGMYPSEDVDRSIGLRPVMRLESSLVKITRYDREWTVGYGRTWKVGPGSVVGIVPIGYGDGFPRILSSRGEVLVHGKRMPIAGRVSMDMIAVDLTSLPEDAAVGDEVVLMGRQEWFPEDHRAPARSDGIDALELARLCNTITYEITCGLTIRVPRVYIRGGQIVAVQTMREGYKVL
jgi:alanine racemase